jgi:uncharacterized protein YlxW (UPF0749 family)
VSAPAEPDSAVLVEFRRRQDENENLKAENGSLRRKYALERTENNFLRAEIETLNAEKANYHDSAQFFARQNDDCAIERRTLRAELDKRPSAVGFLGRLRYLLGW